MKSQLILVLSIFMFSTAFSQWYQQHTGNSRLFTVDFVNENIGWAGGDNETLLKTTDGGNTWMVLSQSLFSTDFIHDLNFLDSLDGWMVLSGFVPDRHTQILNTTDGGITWSQQQYIYGFTLHSIYFADQNNGWTVGSNGLTLHTSDGGLNWYQQFNSAWDGGYWLYPVFFINSNLGWTTGNTLGLFLKTTNSGNTWLNYYLPTSDWITGIYFMDENLGWLAGDNGKILKTVNGGISWTLKNSGTNIRFRDIKFVNENTGWAIGYSGTILMTTDGGETWILQSSSTYNDLFSIDFMNDYLGWCVGDAELILNTLNGGLPVELVSFNATLSGNNVELSWITSTEINNQGFEIQRRSSASDYIPIGFVKGHGSTTEMNHYSFTDIINTSDIYNYRLKQMDYDGSFEYSNEVLIEYSVMNFNLNQNFPNPFNPSTKITFGLPVKSQVRLSVFNSLGEEVTVLTDNEISAGTHSFEFDAKNLSSGFYFYRIEVEGKDGSHWTESKKMILMK